MINSSDAGKNHLLSALPVHELDRWLPMLERVELALGTVIQEPGMALGHIYFPATAIVSLLNVTTNGSYTEISMVGNEGAVGVSLFMSGQSMPVRAVVKSSGDAFRMKAKDIKEEFAREPVLALMLRYTQTLISQAAQIAVCNRHHSLDQQLCRSLLLSLDCIEGNQLDMTQELIANSLGVRREGVTEAALRLQNAGHIRYARGHILVLDRAGLEQRSCECYLAIRSEYERLLPRTSNSRTVTSSTSNPRASNPKTSNPKTSNPRTSTSETSSPRTSIAETSKSEASNSRTSISTTLKPGTSGD